jgi:aryl-alcohol dehydrogenase-like predicted oxidoreductase
MQSARLGKSNMQASRLALGTMNFGVRTPEADAFAIMDRALELGINLFDTANIYGQTTTNPDGQGITEEVMGRWFGMSLSSCWLAPPP